MAGLASIGNMFTTSSTSTITGISTMSEECWRYMQSQAQMQQQCSPSSGDAMVAMKQEPNPVLLLLED